jgi:UDP-N-acetylmuramoyl-L-alanyl-D-glutamate--2,6-diaminopimelate ligase
MKSEITRQASKLFQEIQFINGLPQDEDSQVTGICIDSRKISAGNIYLAIPGKNVDGHDFIEDAVSKGTAIIVGSKPYQEYLDLPVPYLQVEDCRQVLAQITAAWFDFPARKMIIIGVTGTDGKTTTVNLIYQILLAAGLKAGLISTVNAVIGDKVLDTGFHVTTPEAQDVQRYLAEMVNAGITHVVLEATSHGLAQKRVAACEFDLGVVTNVTHEHLDFHGDYQDYLDAKAELLRLVSGSVSKKGDIHKLVVLNKDDQSFGALDKIAGDLDLRRVSYGIVAEGQFVGSEIQNRPQGVAFQLHGMDQTISIQTKLHGEYNVLNCLAAAAVCSLGLVIEEEYVQQGIENLPGIPGRMEIFDLGQDFMALVDFAHTPNALKVALSAARKMAGGRVIAVFGSAGLRDREKRRLMAEVSADLADVTILTAEDPRTESLDDILEEMAAGLISKGGAEERDFWRIPDRGDAIRFGLKLAKPGDIVIVCGKGHEQSMCFEEVEYPWDDRTALESALAEFLGIPGPDMPFLPTSSENSDQKSADW